MGRLVTASMPWKNGPRRYLVWLPDEWRAGYSWPAVFVFHGGASDADTIRTQSKMCDVADANRFVAIFPDGYSPFPRSDRRTWNAISCCGAAKDANVDDVSFVLELVSVATIRFALDRTRLYAAGFSNGAMLAHLLGARLSSTFAAIGPVSGDLGDLSLPPPTYPVPVIYFHGKKDTHIPYGGGIGDSALDKVPHNSVIEVVGWWTSANRSPSQPEIIRGEGFARSIYTPTGRFPAAAPVEVYTLLNGGHQWPGGVSYPGLGQIVPQVNASALMWEFFKGYHR